MAGVLERQGNLHRPAVQVHALPALDWRIYAIGCDGFEGWSWTPGYPWQGGFAVGFPSADIPEITRRLERYR